ncbi:hypothetical protein D3C76_1780640 [compost metagenome]
MDRPAVVVQDLVAFPVPGTDPGRDGHVFTDPAVKQIAGGVVEQAIEAVPVDGLSVGGSTHGNLVVG